MRFRIITQRLEKHLTLSVDGDVLTLNGEELDFSFLQEGEWLPTDAVGNEWIGPGGVERIDGKILLTIIIPYGRNPPAELLSPPAEVEWGVDWLALPAYGEPINPTPEDLGEPIANG
ncbi:hypothetical protein [Palleronia sp. LCG004]|uniref:hypothetical protein n=1 Tax=Palleronia sp. LCG004 TaxID=3079304 RepID=UPI0029436230|nr:hypothetical protein [Palleronia sp. LCG004]WOI54950.1 hypothetical protein RVY76_07685 [Palleronia sp. LCG004]